METQEIPRLYEEVVQAMSEEEQALLVPYYAYGYTPEEMSAALGIDESSVRSRVHRAMKRMREKLGVTVD